MFDHGRGLFQVLLSQLDRFFDTVYGSKYNPLYRSGTLALGLLLIVLATGTYLLFFYKLSAPFESIVAIDQQVVLARWVRSLHRYASDLAVVVVVFHVFRMMAEGKTWGPRFLAWITGVALLLIFFVVGWTGYILIWDQHAQALAVAGAKMINSIPLFRGVLTRSVSGATTVGSSFFFLNLFLHMSLPLGMIFGLWLHTSNLRKPAWLLPRKYFVGLCLAMVAISVLWPAPLSAPADLLNLNEKFFLDVFFGFVIPMVHGVGATWSFWGVIGFFLLMSLVPAFWRPRRGYIPAISKHNPQACTGCGQCDDDCPFEAIDMVARVLGEGSLNVAQVDSTACVGCGLCAASCSQMAIGPEDKSSRVQLQVIKNLKSQSPPGETLFVHCKKNPLGQAFLNREARAQAHWQNYAIDCTGNLHVASVAFALGHFEQVIVVGCPAHACENRLGQELLEQRFIDHRPPEAPARMSFDKVRVFSGGLAERRQLEQMIFEKKSGTGVNRWGLAAAVSLVGLYFLTTLSAVPFEHTVGHATLRLAVRLPGQVRQICRQRQAQELAALPAHMRNAQECTRRAQDYALKVSVDDKIRFEKTLTAGGARGDKPLAVEEDFDLSAGSHHVRVEFHPLEAESTEALVLDEDFVEDFEGGRAVLVSFNQNLKSLFHTKITVK